MRHTIAGWVAGAALAVTMGAAPAKACAVTGPCSPNYHYGLSPQPHSTYDGTVDRVADPLGPQYYYVNQGPLYTGPGRLAPQLTYQERAVVGWHGYGHAHRYYRPYRAYRHRYTGGPYANPTNHYYHSAPRVHGPAVYTYQPRRTYFRPRPAAPVKYYYTARPGVRYAHPGIAPRHGYAPRFYGSKAAAHGPRLHNIPQYAGPRPAAPRAGRPQPKPQI